MGDFLERSFRVRGLVIFALELVANCHIFIFFRVMNGYVISIDDTLVVLRLITSEIFHLQLGVIGLQLA